MEFPVSQRMGAFAEPGVFTELAALRRRLAEDGRQILDLSAASPDKPPSLDVREAASKAALQGWNFGYPLGELPDLHQALRSWYLGRYNVPPGPDAALLPVSGTAEGLLLLLHVFTGPGDIVLLPDPCPPVVSACARLAGAAPVFLPLRAENGYLPDLPAVPAETARAAKAIFVSYPNDPTGAIAPDGFYQELLAFARAHGILVLHDAAYSDLVYDGPPGRSILEFEGAAEVCAELNSLSASYAMPGARMAVLAGSAETVERCARLKGCVDLGSFLPAQYAAVAALTGDQADVEDLRCLYRDRRDALVSGLRELGLSPAPCRGTPFVWLPLPERRADDREFVRELLDKTGVLVTPGSAFGGGGRGHVRIALTARSRLLRQAAAALGEIG